MAWEIIFKPAARRDLKKLPEETLSRVLRSITTLRENPYGPGIEKLRSNEDFYRLRVGDYRVIFHIDEAQRHVLIARIGDRKEIYRLLVKK